MLDKIKFFSDIMKYKKKMTIILVAINSVYLKPNHIYKVEDKHKKIK